MTAVIVGLAFVAAGLWGFVNWFPAVLFVLKGFGSISLIIGGVVAVLAGVSSMKIQKAARPDAPKE
jgi:hypothetical protein